MSSTLIWAMAIGLGVSILGRLAAMIVIVKLPRDCCSRPERKKGPEGSPARISRNVGGVLLIRGGAVLALPGVPGPASSSCFSGCPSPTSPGSTGCS